MASSINKENTLWDIIKENILTPALTTTDEIQRLLPDSLLFGAFFLYILTHNQSFGVFAIFLLQSSLLHKILASGYNMYLGTQVPAQKSAQCRPGFHLPGFDFLKRVSGNTYPSSSVYSIVSIASYIALSLNNFRETLATMGPEWQARGVSAMVFTMAILFLFVFTRFFRGCETKGEIATALVFGLIAGILLFYTNKALFGSEGINFLGLPILVDKDKEGSPIYVCVSEKINSK
jgi:hypothetical protein